MSYDDTSSSFSGSLGEEKPPIFALEEVHRFICDCMLALNTPTSHAEALATCLTEADYRGHHCEGLSQLETYIDEVRYGACNKDAVPHIMNETPVTAWVDGNNGLGVVVANFCMSLAIQKAKDSGIGWVVAKRSNSYGIAGIYPLQAVEEGLLRMSFTNSSPIVAPSRAIQGALGTNPISLAAPAMDGDSFVLDMATAAVAVGKIEILGRKRMPIPKEWANPRTGTLRPLGGHEPNSNYKGFGLALFVEIFCGILADSGYGPNIPKYGNCSESPNLGHCFIAINPAYFAPGFEERLSDLMNFIRNMEPEDPAKPVLVPGDLERANMALVDRQGGVHYYKDLIKRCSKLAANLAVRALRPVE